MKLAIVSLLVGVSLPSTLLAGALENPFAQRPVQVRRQDIISTHPVTATLSPQWRAEIAAPADGWLRAIVDIGRRIEKNGALATIAPLAKPGASQTRAIALTAPFDGVVTARLASLGSYVRQGQMLLAFTSDENMRVRASLSEKDSVLVREGAKAELEVESLPGRVFESKVSAVVSWIDPASHLRDVECIVANAEHLLVPGMASKLSIPKEIRRNVLVVPRESLVVEKSEIYVFAVREGRARKVKILPGVSGQSLVEIHEGLTEGEYILVNPQYAKEGMPVTLP